MATNNEKMNELDELEMLGTPETVKKLRDEHMAKVRGGLDLSSGVIDTDLDFTDLTEDEQSTEEQIVGRRGTGGTVLR